MGLTMQANDYTIDWEAKLGQGGFGTTYRGKRISDNQVVCIKVISLPHKSPGSVLQEASNLEQLDCPNIIHLYASFHKEDKFYLVMEFAEGGSLQSYIKVFNLQYFQFMSLLFVLETSAGPYALQ